jgi:hypothetical protein
MGVDPARALVLYEGVQQEADDLVREATVTDLTGELVLLRSLLRQQIEKDPGGLELTIKAMHLLVRMVTAQHKLSGGDSAALEAHLGRLANEMALAILGKELGDD